MSSNNIRDEIKHLDYLQRKGLSSSAQRQVGQAIAQKIIQHNDARTSEMKRDTYRQSFDRNSQVAREFFNREGKGRIYR